MAAAGLEQPVETLRGVGPVTAGQLARLGLRRWGELLLHAPRGYQDRRQRDLLSQAATRPRANVVVRVRSRQWIGRGFPRTPRVIVEDESGRAALLCFGRPFLYAQLTPGKRFRVYGSFQMQGRELRASSFDLEEHQEEKAGGIVPLYTLGDGLSQKAFRGLVQQALSRAAEDIRDELPEPLRERRGLPGRKEALRWLHFPPSWEELARARHRLVYEELLGEQLLLARSSVQRRDVRRLRPAPGFRLREALLRRLPFQLTAEQRRVLGEIEGDLAAAHPGGRLLQGEVGCGKTLVALLAALAVIEAGEQVAYLCPTELLARQQADTAARLLEPLGLGVAYLSAAVQGDPRAALMRNLEAGEVDLVVGTHALLSRQVRFRRLGFVIVDEQQRFGVEQRRELLRKGSPADLLLMTATPIPRTLALTAFGDLQLSEIRERPAGRRPVITHLTREGNEGKVYERVRREIAAGGQAYFVYPLIEESDALPLKDAEGAFRRLRSQVFPELRLGLIHSRVPEEEKQRRMAAFARGELDVLVATSVMEVGVDVAGATCMVVEHAERFGLSALHQLRGRVGRGPRQSYAFLIYGRSLTSGGLQRLKAIMSSSDGFRIAEEDLKIRGPGELLGLRQSGYARYELADLRQDWDTLLEARADARELLEAAEVEAGKEEAGAGDGRHL